MSGKERVQYKFMIPSDLKATLEEAAHENRRSLSAEIIHRLQATLEMDAYVPGPNVHEDEEYDAVAEASRLIEQANVLLRKRTGK